MVCFHAALPFLSCIAVSVSGGSVWVFLMPCSAPASWSHGMQLQCVFMSSSAPRSPVHPALLLTEWFLPSRAPGFLPVCIQSLWILPFLGAGDFSIPVHIPEHCFEKVLSHLDSLALSDLAFPVSLGFPEYSAGDCGLWVFPVWLVGCFENTSFVLCDLLSTALFFVSLILLKNMSRHVLFLGLLSWASLWPGCSVLASYSRPPHPSLPGSSAPSSVHPLLALFPGPPVHQHSGALCCGLVIFPWYTTFQHAK